MSKDGLLHHQRISSDLRHSQTFSGADMDPPPAAQRVLKRSKELFKAAVQS